MTSTTKRKGSRIETCSFTSTRPKNISRRTKVLHVVLDRAQILNLYFALGHEAHRSGPEGTKCQTLDMAIHLHEGQLTLHRHAPPRKARKRKPAKRPAARARAKPREVAADV